VACPTLAQHCPLAFHRVTAAVTTTLPGRCGLRPQPHTRVHARADSGRQRPCAPPCQHCRYPAGALFSGRRRAQFRPGRSRAAPPFALIVLGVDRGPSALLVGNPTPSPQPAYPPSPALAWPAGHGDEAGGGRAPYLEGGLHLNPSLTRSSPSQQMGSITDLITYPRLKLQLAHLRTTTHPYLRVYPLPSSTARPSWRRTPRPTNHPLTKDTSAQPNPTTTPTQPHFRLHPTLSPSSALLADFPYLPARRPPAAWAPALGPPPQTNSPSCCAAWMIPQIATTPQICTNYRGAVDSGRGLTAVLWTCQL
jgi:hypothetical protein